MFNSAVDTPNILDVSSSFTSPRSVTTSLNLNRTSPIEYIAILSVDLNNVEKDSGSYTITFNVSSASFITGVSVTETRIIKVEGEL